MFDTTAMQKQHRPDTRAPHGEREFVITLGVRLTADMHRAIMRKGGSGWVRAVIDKALKK